MRIPVRIGPPVGTEEQGGQREVPSEAERAEGVRRVILASPRSFCAGVERAIKVVEQALDLYGPPVYVRRQIVHNTHIINDLSARGAVFVDEPTDVPSGSVVVFSAHGVSPRVREEAAERNLSVIDATCPLVGKVHAEARRFSERGDTILLVGSRDHEEIEGTSGEAPDSTIVVEDAAEAAAVEVSDPTRVSYLTQTTLATDETAEVLEVLRERFPDLRGPGSEDICYAATNRQSSLRAVADESDLVLVVGSENSANSRHLAELARRNGTPAQLIDSHEDIGPESLSGVEVVGVTAGASAPPELVEGVVEALGGRERLTVDERVTTVEDVHFGLPSALRQD